MNDFIQMDIFFFISSVAAVVFLLFVLVVGIYVMMIVRSVKTVVREVEDFATFASAEGKKSLAQVSEKIEDIMAGSGVVERTIVTALGTVIAKTVGKRGKIKRDARKK